ncbi:hypothetical protein AQF52_6950 [Streptomyces venezuelae]|nr:hypothetical protein AQF52_6950 [Streptomyces venezuelae]
MSRCRAFRAAQLVVGLDIQVEAVPASDDPWTLGALELKVDHQAAIPERDVYTVLVDVPLAHGVTALGSEGVHVRAADLFLLPACRLACHASSPSLLDREDRGGRGMWEQGLKAQILSRSWQGFFLATGVQKDHGFVLEAVCGQ